MKELKDFPHEFAKPFNICFDLINICDIRFFETKTSFLGRNFRLLIRALSVVICHISMSFYMAGIFSSNVKITELAFMVPAYLVTTQALLKAAVLIPKKSDLENLIVCLGTIWRPDDDLSDIQIEKKDQLLKRLNFVLTIFYWGSKLTIWVNLIIPLLLTFFRKFLLKQESEFLLIVEYVFPFDPLKNWFLYISTYIFQIYTLTAVSFWHLGTGFLLITFCGHLSIVFAFLREDLKVIMPNNTKKKTGKVSCEVIGNSYTIDKFIKDHQYVIELSQTLNSMFNEMVFIDLLFATVTISFFAFGATVSHEAMDTAINFFTALTLLLPIYILCYYSELLKEESTGIADSAYENLWYKGNVKYQKIINFIITRSQQPCCLTYLNYALITLNTFTKVVSTIWSYFSLATTMYSED